MKGSAGGGGVNTGGASDRLAPPPLIAPLTLALAAVLYTPCGGSRGEVRGSGARIASIAAADGLLVTLPTLTLIAVGRAAGV